jgi:hypothetical protein
MARKTTRSTKKKQSRWQPVWTTLSQTPNALRGDAGGWVVFGLFAIGLAIATPSLRRAVSATAPRAQEVRFVDTPDWIGKSLITHLGRIATQQIGTEAPTQHQLIAIHTALEDSGWFDRINQVRRTTGGDIEVQGVFLNPVAVITDSHGDVLVDQSGQPLPHGTKLDGDDHRLRIIHPGEDRPARPRRTWQGDDISAALALLTVLKPHPWINQIESIDLASYNHNGSLTLHTDQCTIVWGSAPREETNLETLCDRKLVWLTSQYNASGRIDGYHHGELDLRSSSHFVKTN